MKMKRPNFDLFEEYANTYFDGHYTIMKFTTNYRVRFGTIEAQNYDELCEAIDKMTEGKTLEDACKNIIFKLDSSKRFT